MKLYKINTNLISDIFHYMMDEPDNNIKQFKKLLDFNSNIEEDGRLTINSSEVDDAIVIEAIEVEIDYNLPYYDFKTSDGKIYTILCGEEVNYFVSIYDTVYGTQISVAYSEVDARKKILSIMKGVIKEEEKHILMLVESCKDYELEFSKTTNNNDIERFTMHVEGITFRLSSKELDAFVAILESKRDILYRRSLISKMEKIMDEYETL